LVGGIPDNPSKEQDTMITRYVGLALIAGTIAACSDEPMAPQMATASAPAFSKGVSSPNTSVGSNFVIYVGGSTYYAGSGLSRNGQGECHTHTDGTVGWYWVPGNNTAGGKGKGGGASSGAQEVGPNHAQCRFVNGGYTVTVNFSEVATYVKSSSGNYALNFNPFCVPDVDATLPPTCDSRYVHYQLANDLSQGYGILHGVGVRSDDQSTSNWTIDLSQIHSSSNLIADPPRQLVVTVHNEDGSYPDSPATITW
jgi:hypothetical protein